MTRSRVMKTPWATLSRARNAAFALAEARQRKVIAVNAGLELFSFLVRYFSKR